MNDAAPVMPFGIIPPNDTPEYMYEAYFSCFFWAIRFDPILHEFLKDTGRSIPKPPTPFEQMIDQATGFNPYKEFVHAFVPWFNQWVWGAMDGADDDQD